MTPGKTHFRTAKYVLLALAVALSMAVLDVPVSKWAHDHEPGGALLLLYRVVRLPGYVGFTIAIAAALAWRRQCRWSDALWVVVNPVVASGLAALIKVSAGRLRPFKGREAFDWAPLASMWWDDTRARNLAFPSGDATLAFATAATIAVVCPAWRWPAWAWAAAVAVVRVLQGAHYPSDVIAALLVAVATTDASARVVQILRAHAGRSAPGTALN